MCCEKVRWYLSTLISGIFFFSALTTSADSQLRPRNTAGPYPGFRDNDVRLRRSSHRRRNIPAVSTTSSPLRTRKRGRGQTPKPLRVSEHRRAKSDDSPPPLPKEVYPESTLDHQLSADESATFDDGSSTDSRDEFLTPPSNDYHVSGYSSRVEPCGATCCENSDCCKRGAGGNCPCLSWLRVPHHLSCLGSWKQQLNISQGVHGFKNPVGRGESSFGVHEGVNFAIPLGQHKPWGWQVGFEATHSNFSGANFSNSQLSDTTFGSSTNDNRNQLFVTTGFFRRTYCGLQFGIAWDYLHENWDTRFNLGQIRGEVSWKNSRCQEIGFWFATDTRDDQIFDNSVQVETTDLYTFFYRYAGNCGGTGRIFAGWSGASDQLVGTDFELPMNCHWAVRSEFAYLIPEESTNNGGSLQESWNVGISLVWYPGGNANVGCCSPSRPFFRVANNGSMFVDIVNP